MAQAQQAVVKEPCEGKHEKQRYKTAAGLLTLDFLCGKRPAAFPLQAAHTDYPDHFADRKEQQDRQYQNGKIKIRCHRLNEVIRIGAGHNNTEQGLGNSPKGRGDSTVSPFATSL
jgi:hypothetical protein